MITILGKLDEDVEVIKLRSIPVIVFCKILEEEFAWIDALI
jgi:hypothetical protein